MGTCWLECLRRYVDRLLIPTRIRGSWRVESGGRVVDLGAEFLGHNEIVIRIAREQVTEATTESSKSAKVA